MELDGGLNRPNGVTRGPSRVLCGTVLATLLAAPVCLAFAALSAQAVAQDAQRPDPLAPVGGRIAAPLGSDPRYVPVGADPRYDPITRGRGVVTPPDFAAQGQYVGSFLLYPSLTLSETFSDNIFAVESGEESDLISNVQPGLRVQSDWGRHAVVFDIGADIGLYAFNPDENYEDYSTGLGGRVDVFGGSYISANVSFQDLHEGRGAPDAVTAGEEPTEFDVYSGGLEGYYPSGRFNFTLNGDLARLDYDDVGAIGAGLPDIDNDDRDRNIYAAGLRAGYEIVPEYEAFVRVGGNLRDYDDAVDNEGFDRDSFGFEGAAGIAIDFTGLIFGDFFIGYNYQEFDDSDLNSVQGVNAGADITWDVTALTTLNLFLATSVEDTTIAGASGFQAYQGAFTVDHELLRSLLLRGQAGGSLLDYEGIDRLDVVPTAEVSAKYFLNRYVNTAVGYRYRTRFSNDSTVEEFGENIVYLSLTAQY